ncbi:hypothetical protein Tco_0964766 [Tanacetum coccineum]
MSASRQGMSSEEMDHGVAQRVANAIETIAIYESKIHMAHDSMNPVVREEATVGKNVSNKRKWGKITIGILTNTTKKRIEKWLEAHVTGHETRKFGLRVEKKMYVIEQSPISPLLRIADSSKQNAGRYGMHIYSHKRCLDLKSMFEKQAGVERFDLIQTFHACKQEEGKTVLLAYVLKWKDM